MSWEWSHTQEAYDRAEKMLYKKSKKFLAECYAEIKSDDRTEEEQNCLPFFNEDKYNETLKEAKRRSKEWLAEYVWNYASFILRTCDNGGHNPWMCPHGCHKVEW